MNFNLKSAVNYIIAFLIIFVLMFFFLKTLELEDEIHHQETCRFLEYKVEEHGYPFDDYAAICLTESEIIKHQKALTQQ